MSVYLKNRKTESNRNNPNTASNNPKHTEQLKTVWNNLKHLETTLTMYSELESVKRTKTIKKHMNRVWNLNELKNTPPEQPRTI